VSLRLRPARPADLRFLLSLAPRLAEFGVPPWRARAQVVDAERRALTRALEAGSPDAPILITEDAERRGVGRALLEAAEDWARGRGHPFISLNVFTQNTRARSVYERLGYGPETLRYVKPLEQNAAS
jgi:GNAT superfamily N-acetyltransferase